MLASAANSRALVFVGLPKLDQLLPLSVEYCQAPFVVLIGASMPSILAEIGFVSNAHDESVMRREEYRERTAEALYKGISSYASSLSHFQVAKRE